MKNIGIICYPTFGGSGIIASKLGVGLSKKYKVHFICYEKPVKLNLDQSNIFFHKVHIPDYPLFEYPPYELALTSRIIEVVEKHRLDLIHVHYAIPHAYAALNAQRILMEKNINLPIVTTLHGTDITLVGKSPYILSAVNYAINNSSVVTAVSENLKLETLKNFNISNDIHVVPNFIELTNVNKSHSKQKTNIISHISNFRPVKRVLDVIEIFEIVARKMNVKLIMVGDGPDFQKARNLVSAKKLDSVVDFIGATNDIEEVLCKTDLFLLPSESESFGLVALEAMSFGIPVVSTCSGGITELILNDFNGYTCRVGDVAQMAQSAINILSNNILYQKMSDNAYSTAVKHDINSVIPLYEECYKKALN